MRQFLFSSSFSLLPFSLNAFSWCAGVILWTNSRLSCASTGWIDVDFFDMAATLSGDEEYENIHGVSEIMSLINGLLHQCAKDVMHLLFQRLSIRGVPWRNFLRGSCILRLVGDIHLPSELQHLAQWIKSSAHFFYLGHKNLNTELAHIRRDYAEALSHGTCIQAGIQGL